MKRASILDIGKSSARYKPYKTMSGELCVCIPYNNEEFSSELVDALNRFPDFCRDCVIQKIVE